MSDLYKPHNTSSRSSRYLARKAVEDPTPSSPSHERERERRPIEEVSFGEAAKRTKRSMPKVVDEVSGLVILVVVMNRILALPMLRLLSYKAHKDAKNFENDVIPVMLVFIG